MTEDLLRKSQQGERRSDAGGGMLIAHLKEGSTLINRVELVNQAISTIKRISLSE
jgi:hypothetical protein